MTTSRSRGTSTRWRWFAPLDVLKAKADDVLRRAAGRRGHVFNLGHGILPRTPVEHVVALVEHVRDASPDEPELTRQVEVLVAGAGVSGLTVAYDLTRSGIDCLVAERAERAGGLISTRSIDGYVMDPGPDAFLTQKPQAMALCGELGLTPEIIPTNRERQKVFVLRGGKLHALPAGMRLTVPTRVLPLLTSDLFTVGGKLRLLAEWLVPRRREATEESIARVRHAPGSGPRLSSASASRSSPGIHCGDARRLSMDVLFPRLVDLEARYGSVSRGMVRAGGPGGETAFSSLAPGMRRLIDALLEKLPEERVLLGREVVAVSRDGADYVSELASGESVRSRALVVALPIRAAETLTRSSFPELAEPLSRIQTVSSAVVFHAFDQAAVSHPLDGYGFVVPDGEPNRLLAATFVTTKFPGRAPEGKLLFRTFSEACGTPRRWSSTTTSSRSCRARSSPACSVPWARRCSRAS